MLELLKDPRIDLYVENIDIFINFHGVLFSDINYTPLDLVLSRQYPEAIKYLREHNIDCDHFKNPYT